MMIGLVAEGEGGEEEEEQDSHSKVGTLWVRQSQRHLQSTLNHRNPPSIRTSINKMHLKDGHKLFELQHSAALASLEHVPISSQTR